MNQFNKIKIYTIFTQQQDTNSISLISNINPQWKENRLCMISVSLDCEIFAPCFMSQCLRLPGGSAGKESACSAGDLGLISGLGRCPGEGKGYPLQYSGLENSTDYSPWGCKEWDTTEWLSLGGKGFPGGIGGKAPTCQCRRSKRCRFDPWIGEFPWRRAWQSTPVVLAWRIPWTEEPGGLQSTWSPSVRHDWVTEHESLNTASKHAIVSPFSQYCSWVLLPLWLIPASSFRE